MRQIAQHRTIEDKKDLGALGRLGLLFKKFGDEDDEMVELRKCVQHVAYMVSPQV